MLRIGHFTRVAAICVVMWSRRDDGDKGENDMGKAAASSCNVGRVLDP
jgi:hypothetical protein